MEEEDLYNTAKKLEAAIKRIKDSERIIEANKEKLVEFTNHCLADGVGKNISKWQIWSSGSKNLFKKTSGKVDLPETYALF